MIAGVSASCGLFSPSPPSVLLARGPFRRARHRKNAPTASAIVPRGTAIPAAIAVVLVLLVDEELSAEVVGVAIAELAAGVAVADAVALALP